MSGDYEVGALTVANIPRAYAVIQHLFSAVSFQEWQAATDTDRKRRDWLTVTDRCHAQTVRTCHKRKPQTPARNSFRCLRRDSLGPRADGAAVHQERRREALHVSHEVPGAKRAARRSCEKGGTSYVPAGHSRLSRNDDRNCFAYFHEIDQQGRCAD